MKHCSSFNGDFLKIAVLAISCVLSATTALAQSESSDTVKTQELKEVVIEGRSQRVIDNGVEYIPEKKLKNVASNAYDLLRKMQSPQLQIPKNADDPLKFINGGELTYYINGVKANPNEERSILSKDVIKIEILASPTDPRFGGDKYVVNIVTKQYSAGGYTYLNARQDLTFPKGAYSVTSILESGNSTFGVGIEYRWLNKQKCIEESENHYTMQDSEQKEYELINKSQETSRTSQQSVDVALQWKYRMAPQRAVLVLNAGITGYDNPTYMSGSSTYNIEGYDNVEYKRESSGYDWTPYVSLLFSKRFSDKDHLNLSYLFGALLQSSHRSYAPKDREAIVNDTKSTAYINNLRLYYQHKFNDVHSVSATLLARPEYHTATYSGTDNSMQNLINFIGKLNAGYTFSKNRWNISLQACLGLNTVKINDEHPGTSFIPGASADFWVQPADRHSLFGNLSYSTTNLPIKSLNTVTRIDGDFIGAKGNADIKHAHSLSAYLSYTWLASEIFSMTLTPIWNHTFNPYQRDYVSVNDVMYTYTANGGSYDDFRLSLKANIALFSKKFIIAPELTLKRQQVTGIYNDKLWAFQPSLSMQYVPANHWYFGVNAMMRNKNIFSGGNVSHPGQKLDITINAGYYTKGFECALMISPMPLKEDRSYLSNPIADICNSLKREQICPYVVLTLSYYFEYGRKPSERTDVQTEYVGSSAVM